MKITKEILIKKIKQEHDFINRMILANQTMLVNSLLEQQYESINFECNYKSFTFEDWLNFCKEDKTEILSNISLDKERITKKNFDEWQLEIAREARNLGLINNEIYQYFLVDSWLLSMLEEKGEIIANWQDNEQWWGRQCCGQSILLDSVIEEIAADKISRSLDITAEELGKLFQENSLYHGWLCNANFLS